MPRRVPDLSRSIASVEGSKIKRAGFTARSRKGGIQMNEGVPPNPAPRARQGTDYSEHADVQQVHAAIQREKREPRVGLEPLSIWLIAVYGLALFCGGAYLGRYSGNFSGDSLDISFAPPKPKGPGGGGGAAQ